MTPSFLTGDKEAGNGLHHANSPKKMRFKTAPSTGKVMVTVFFDSEGLLLVDIMPHGTKINSDAYVATLKELQARVSRVRPHRDYQDVLLLHDNARLHVSHKTTDQFRKLGWTTPKHPPVLAPCDYHLFSKLKKSLHGTMFEDDDSLMHVAKEWLRRVGPDFYCAEDVFKKLCTPEISRLQCEVVIKLTIRYRNLNTSVVQLPYTHPRILYHCLASGIRYLVTSGIAGHCYSLKLTRKVTIASRFVIFVHIDRKTNKE
ncbi:hypothetical protein ANN_03072 [Periplaneta americana]|uniref:Mariner Mos1 transposase n=1 Tax=Periplaneta americana TaxID=6978 RepID=A0ABQ8TY55_PERAM|nr:hypothetical protein ANN_03072 [Periplaneta americana]